MVAKFPDDLYRQLGERIEDWQARLLEACREGKILEEDVAALIEHERESDIQINLALAVNYFAGSESF